MATDSAPGDAIIVVAAVIEDNGRYLITRRRPSAVLPLLWEFPGGKVEPGEDDQSALTREVMHRLGVQIEVAELMNTVRHNYDRYTVELHLYACKIVTGEPSSRNVHEFRWTRSDDFEQFQFTPADERSMSLLLGIN